MIRFATARQTPRFLFLFLNLKTGVIQLRAGVGRERGTKARKAEGYGTGGSEPNHKLLTGTRL